MDNKLSNFIRNHKEAILLLVGGLALFTLLIFFPIVCGTKAETTTPVDSGQVDANDGVGTSTIPENMIMEPVELIVIRQ